MNMEHENKIRYGLIHCHTENSLKDSALKPADLVRKAKELGATAVSLTDHGNLLGIYEFEHACKDADIKPIYGCELYVQDEGIAERRSHMVVLAKNYDGYRALSDAVTASNRRIDKGIPRVNTQILKENFGPGSKGYGNVIATSACVGGILSLILLKNNYIKEQMSKIEKKMSKWDSPEDPAYLSNKLSLENLSEEIKRMMVERDEMVKIAGKKYSSKERSLKAIKAAGDEGEYLKAKEALEREKAATEKAEKDLPELKKKIAFFKKRETALRQKCAEAEKNHVKWNFEAKTLESLKAEMKPDEKLYSECMEKAIELENIFGKGNFYIELQYHGIEDEQYIMPILADMAQKLSIPVVAANDVHYANNSDDDIRARRIIRSLRFNKWEEEMPGDREYYIKTDAELADWLQKILPEEIVEKAFLGIGDIVEACNVAFPHGLHTPAFKSADGESGRDRLKRLSYEAIPVKYGSAWTPAHQERLEYELSVIEELGYSDYLCIVEDFLRYGRKLGTENPEGVGLGIGSGRGCVNKDTLIYTDKGLIPIQEIKVGDYVYAQDGNLHQVKATHKYPLDKREILFNPRCYYGDVWGNSYTAEHKILAVKCIRETNKTKLAQGIKYQYIDNPKPEWIYAKDLEVGDMLCVPKFKVDIVEKRFDLSDYANDKCIIADNELVETSTNVFRMPVQYSIRDVNRKTGISKTWLRKAYADRKIGDNHTANKFSMFLNNNALSFDEWCEIIDRIKEVKEIKMQRFIDLDEDLAFALGTFTGNGWVRKNRKDVGICFHKDKVDENVINTINDIFGLSENRASCKNIVTITWQSRILHDFILDFWEGYEYTAQTKNFPDYMFHVSPNIRLAFVKGLWSTDGSHKGKSKYTSASYGLICKLKVLLCTLNIPNGLMFRKAHFEAGAHVENNNDSWQIIVPHNFDVIRRANGQTDENFVYKRIYEINTTNDSFVYDISVEGDHSYVTSNFVAHNSAVGSIVCYLTGITGIDPMKHNLLFERFLNKDRVSMPDIDSDFAIDIREKVVEYVKGIYGDDAVCNITTKGTLAAKNAVRSAARILGDAKYGDTRRFLSLGDEIAKIIPNEPGIKLSDCKEELDAFINADAKQIIADARLIEGVAIQTGVHAAGVIIADNGNVSEYVPLMWNGDKNCWCSQCDMVEAEGDAGLLKMDFLGLRNLNIISECLRTIKREHGISIDIEAIGRELKADGRNTDHDTRGNVFDEIFAKGRTNAVFQFESNGMKSMLRQFKPTNIDDVILLVAAYRPGPMQYLDDITATKHGRKKPVYIVPEMKEILGNTYGYPVYQEQIMQIFNKIAGFSLGESDIIRRYMSKKKTEKFAAYKDKFVEGLIVSGAKKTEAEDFWNQLLDFSKYAFNKSHATAYAYIAFYTAWLKLNYPAEYMTAVLNYTPLDKLQKMVAECREMGISVLPPDINESDMGFRYKDGDILFGLGKIKGVGKSIDALIKIRKEERFHSFKDYILRGHLKKNVTEALIDCGALDMWCSNRNAMKFALEPLAKDAKKIAEKKELLTKETDPKKIASIEKKILEYSERFEYTILPTEVSEDELERLQKELDLLGMYVSGHPLDEYEKIKKIRTCPISEAAIGHITLCGSINNVHETRRKSDGKPMAFFELEDESGKIDICCFTKAYENVGKLICNGSVVAISGNCVLDDSADDEDEEHYKLFVSDIKPVERSLKKVVITVPDLGKWTDEIYPKVKRFEGKNFEVLLHDKMLSEIRTTELCVNANLLSACIDNTDIKLFSDISA